MGKDSREIRQEIEETRERMGETIEALGYKADVPSRVKDNINERVETVKGVIGDAVASAKGAIAGTASTAKDSLDGNVSHAKHALGDTKHAIGDTTADGVAGAKRAIGLAMENPIGLAFGALAIGFLAGLAIPVSDLEREKLGPIRDNLIDQAKDATSELVEHGKSVLSETAHAAMASATTHLSDATDGPTTPGALLDHGKAVIAETAQAAVAAAQSHLSDATVKSGASSNPEPTTLGSNGTMPKATTDFITP